LEISYPYADLQVPLKNLLRDLDAVTEFRCSIALTLPREVQDLRLQTVSLPATASGSDARLTLRNVDANAVKRPQQMLYAPSVARFDFVLDPVRDRALCWRALPGTTNPVGVATPERGWAVPPASGEFSVFLQAVPNQFEFKVVTPGDKLTWDCRLTDIPLPRPPRKLEPARFEGYPAPVEVLKAAVSGDGVELRVVNRCQKAIDRVEVKVAYRDGEGRVVRSAVAKVSWDGNTADEESDLAVKPAPGRRYDTAAAQLWQLQDPLAIPKEVKSVEATVAGVLFKDGTAWRP
jgi:hypothetical protein